MTSYERYTAMRDERGETNYRVAISAGIGQFVLSNWKNGKTEPSLDTLAKLARHFGCHIEDFLNEVEPCQ